MTVKLSEAIKRYGYDVVIDPATPFRKDVDGHPDDPNRFRGCLACKRQDGSIFFALAADNWQFAGEAAHEIAELTLGRAHTPQLYFEQSQIMQDWITAYLTEQPTIAYAGYLAPMSMPVDLRDKALRSWFKEAIYPDEWLELRAEERAAKQAQKSSDDEP